MNAGHIAVPPIQHIAAALRCTTDRLGRELNAPARDPPGWSEFEWDIARASAALHGVSSLLHARLTWSGPPSWRAFLETQRFHSLERDRKIAAILAEVDAGLARQGVVAVALKGAVLRANGLYARGERPMGDVDLLIISGDRAAVPRALESCGYEHAFGIRRHEVFRPLPRAGAGPAGMRPAARLGEHVDDPIKIEVHTRIAEQLPVAEVDITGHLRPAEMRPGINAYPSDAALMLHLLLHAAGNMRARALRLIQLHDIALLAARFSAGDWDALLGLCASGRAPWWAFPPTALTARLYRSAIPDTVLTRMASVCPPRLMRHALRRGVSDVSWSKVRIEAFPGVEWARTLRETLTLMRGRIWPGREARAELREGAAQIPGSALVPWYGISHGARMARWIFSRPPRVQTILSVHAALLRE
ncbi:MAG TPA: nucleotidyltransferase family protein [Steroidobacteraceae bacterium]|jgi:hypothetical protein|nr:nucleotidyltransferase family protein [Steroidobacteraceae bacterium]